MALPSKVEVSDLSLVSFDKIKEKTSDGVFLPHEY